jgi:Spy/CpxP family protein refolding chaperone
MKNPIKNARLPMLAAALLSISGWSAAQALIGQDAIAQNLFTPELVIAHQKEIGLDDAQKNFIRTELQQAQSQFTDMQWKLRDNTETLAELLKQNTADEEKVLGQLDKVLNAEREIKRAQIALMVRIKNKLTAEQQTRLRQLRNESALH